MILIYSRAIIVSEVTANGLTECFPRYNWLITELFFGSIAYFSITKTTDVGGSVAAGMAGAILVCCSGLTVLILQIL
jgi:hypothetical protein